jgi:peptide/nickel transport system permease protein
MLKLASRRLAMAVPMVLVISFLIFVLIDLAPGDPALRLAGENPTPQLVEQIREAYKLNDPIWKRYANWLAEAAEGDFGTSFSTGEKVTTAIGDKIAVTASLAAVAMTFTILIGFLTGLVGATRPNGWLDHGMTVTATLAMAMPPFWLGMILVISLALDRAWFPAVGYKPLSEGFGLWLNSLILPAFALAAAPIAETSLQLKNALTEAMQRDYVLAARAKGIPGWRILTKHALKNAAIPVVTVLGMRVSQMLGGAVVIDQVFVLNGLGTLAVTSTFSGDIPVLLGLIVLTTTVVIAVNLLVDISYGYFNPKVRR